MPHISSPKNPQHPLAPTANIETSAPKPALQADRLVAALHVNLKHTTEPALVIKLRAAIDRIQAARRRHP